MQNDPKNAVSNRGAESSASSGTTTARVVQTTFAGTPKERLDRLRDSLGISLDDLGIRLGISRSTMYNVRAGRTPLSKRLKKRVEMLEAGEPRATETTTSSKAHIIQLVLGVSPLLPIESGGTSQRITVPVEYIREVQGQPSQLVIQAPGALHAIEVYSAAIQNGRSEDILRVIGQCLPDPYSSITFLNTLTMKSVAALLQAALIVILGTNWKATLNTALQRHL